MSVDDADDGDPGRVTAKHGGERERRWGFAFWVVLVVGIGVRFWAIGRQDLWIDESASWHFAIEKNLGQILRSEPTNPPAYYLMLHVWVEWFGESETALRMLSLVGSTLTLVLLYAWAWPLGKRVALGAMTYLSISTFQIYYAQEARGFAWLSLWVLGGTALLWHALHDDVRRRRYALLAGYALMMTLALYTHFLATVFLGAHALYVAVYHRQQFTRVIESWTAAGASLLAFSPWLLTMLQTAASGRVGEARRYLWLKLPQTFFSFLFGNSLVPMDEFAVNHVGSTLRDNFPLLLLAIVATSLVGYWLLKSLRIGMTQLRLIVWMASVPVITTFLISFKIMILDERYMIAASPFVILAVVAGIEHGIRARPAMGKTVVGCYALLLIVSGYRYYFDARMGKEQWREAIAFVEQNASANDVVVLDPDFLRYVFQYYQTRNLLTIPMVPGHNDWQNRLRETPRVWMIRAFQDGDGNLQQVRTLRRQASFRAFPRAHGIEVYSFVP